MDAFSFDFAELESRLKPANQNIKAVETNKVPFDNNKAKFVKKAFDMFQSKYDNTLWELAEEDGAKFLIKRTDLEDSRIEVQADKNNKFANHLGHWTVASDSTKPVVLFFLGIPVKEFAPKKFGYDNGTKSLFAQHILDTIKNKKEIAKKYICAAQCRNDLIKKCKENIVDDESRLIYSWLAGL